MKSQNKKLSETQSHDVWEIGPVDEITTVSSEQELADIFGKPNSDNFESNEIVGVDTRRNKQSNAKKGEDRCQEESIEAVADATNCMSVLMPYEKHAIAVALVNN